jgi:membrane protein DedA with SNARE-associated domain
VSALASLQVDSLLSYAAAIVFPALDAVLPVLPSETIVITLGVATAGSADPRIALLVACAAAGAFLGDNLCYLLGSRFGPWIERRFFQSEKGAKQRAWAVQSLERYGIPLIIACRFIPGGRTAVMLSCGIIRYDRRRFIIATAIAGVIWACYAFFIGRLGGKAFEDKPWAGLLLAFGGTLAISGLVELVRRLWARRNQRRAGAQGQGDAEHQGDAQGQADVQGQGDETQRQGDAHGHGDLRGQGDAQNKAGPQGHGDTQDHGDTQGQDGTQGQDDDRECGTPSSDDAPRTPVR